MNRLKKAVVIVLCAAFSVGEIAAQNTALQEMQLIRKAYFAIPQISFDGVIKMYEKKNPTKMIDQLNVKYVFQGKKMYYKMGPVEIVRTESRQISVNNITKEVFISPVSQNTKQDPAMIDLNKMNILLNKPGVLSDVKITGTEKILSFTKIPNSIFKKYIITVDATTNFIKSAFIEVVDTYMDEPGNDDRLYLLINYDHILTTGAAAADYCSEKKYIVIGKKKTPVVLTKEYATYKLINEMQ